MDFSGPGHVDEASMQAIIQLLLKDSQDAVAAAIGNGKQPEGVHTDQEVAFNMFIEELEVVTATSADHRMACSMQGAIRADRNAIQLAERDERLAEGDRQLSVSLSDGAAAPPQEHHGEDDKQTGEVDDLIDKLECIYVTGTDELEGDEGLSEEEGTNDDDTEVESIQPESSSWAASRPVKTRSTTRRRCEACTESKPFAQMCRAPCGHEYCRTCITQLFRDASVDETLFPPRCCKQSIPLSTTQIFLRYDVVQRFREKALEFSTPNRTYCHNQVCSKFIPPAQCSDTIGTCSACGARTCTACKAASHGGDCPNDEQLQQVIELARQEGWQRCQNCWGLVELKIGCHHMTCRCGFQFCYLCGTQWKNCQCETWHERRLYERAVEIDERDEHHEPEPPQAPQLLEAAAADEEQPARPDLRRAPPAEPVAQPVVTQREARLRLLMQNLERNHECDHDRWISRPGPRACEECGHTLPIFIYECRQCRFFACRRCRRNRL